MNYGVLALGFEPRIAFNAAAAAALTDLSLSFDAFSSAGAADLANGPRAPSESAAPRRATADELASPADSTGTVSLATSASGRMRTSAQALSRARSLSGSLRRSSNGGSAPLAPL